jgi:hypothetical protein
MAKYTINLDVEIEGENQSEAVTKLNDLMRNCQLKYWMGNITKESTKQKWLVEIDPIYVEADDATEAE